MPRLAWCIPTSHLAQAINQHSQRTQTRLTTGVLDSYPVVCWILVVSHLQYEALHNPAETALNRTEFRRLHQARRRPRAILMAVVFDSGALGGVQEPSQPTLSVPALRKTTSHNTLNRRLELELSPNFGRPDGPQTMSFVSSADITVFAERVERLYEYGWSAVSNPSAQYQDFGQDVHHLYENVGQLEKVYQSVQARSTKRIPPGHTFYDASSLNSLLEEPFRTIKDCWTLLRQRDSFSEERGAIKNMYWNILIEAEVLSLHSRVKAHNAKITALLKPLEIKLLLDIKDLIRDNGDHLLTRLATIEARLFNDISSPGARVATNVQQIQIPPFLTDKFEEASREARPDLEQGGSFPLHHGINAFLSHYREDAATTQFSGGFLLETPTQSPEHFLRMMKTIWIIQRVRESREYIQACQSGNRLIRCFVESLGQKCLENFNRFAQSPPLSVFKVRNEPDPITLSQLGEESFSIWPKVSRTLDIFDTSTMDALKVVFRALLRPTPTQVLNPNSARYKQLLLLRHDNTLLEMIVKETSEADSSTNSQSKNLDLSTVSLNPIYADPDNQSITSMDMGLNTMGNRGSDDHLSFQSYTDLYLFQEAITGYRPILDLLDIDVQIHQDSSTQWRGRIQLWNSQAILNDQPQDSPNSSRRPSLVPSATTSSYQTEPFSQYSSTMSFQTRTTQVTAVTSFMETVDEVTMGIEATTFEPPKQPVLVLFLRPKTQGPSQPQRLSLMKIPMSAKAVQLETKNCSCRLPSHKCDCKHSQLAGVSKKLIGGKKPLLVQRYHNPESINLALLGAHHDKRAKQAEQKLNFVSFTFSSVRDREVFDAHFREYQRLYARRMDSYEREKRSIRFRKDAGSP